MQILHSSTSQSTPAVPTILAAINQVSETHLREVVDAVAIPRHYIEEAESNRRIGAWIKDQLTSFGYQTTFEGEYANVVALPVNSATDELIVVGAHYDSVPGTPGADDNGSAIAAMLECARVIAETKGIPDTAVCFVAFNREEDGLLGSIDFVTKTVAERGLRIAQAHILEMVGYCSHAAGSQHLPPGLPINVGDVGDFLGLIANSHSTTLIDEVLVQAKSYLPEFPVMGLKVPLGLERFLPPLERSDHVPFWRAGIPALMWTDTSEFRNPHYHGSTDTPDTLDYAFLRHVTQLLVATVLHDGNMAGSR